MSEVTVALLAGRDFALEFQGTQPLKGLQGAQALYRLNWQDVGDGSDA